MNKVSLLIGLLLLLVSCRTQREIEIREVPVETVRTEYVYNTRVDSITVRDSIDRYMKGDTLVIYKEHTKFKFINRTDTVVKTEEIPKIIKHETTKEIPVNYMTWYQKTLMWLGVVMSLGLAGFIIYKIKR